MADLITRSSRALFLLLILFGFNQPAFGQGGSLGIPVTRLTEPATYRRLPQITGQTPGLADFIRQVANGDGSTLAGVFVPGIFAFPVVQQPTGQEVYVSDQPGVLTQFRMASQFGTAGFLAHNTLAGAEYFRLSLGQKVFLVRGDGSFREYQINAIHQYQALSPIDPYSKFVHLDPSQGELSSTDVFNQVYTRNDQVVFQTCIAKDGNASWGRIFIVATPLKPTWSF